MKLVLVWLALLGLLAATAASAYVPMGDWNSAVNMGISCIKALLVAVFFMHLRHAGALLRLVAIAALLWLALLFGLSSTDYAARDAAPAPWALRP
jgi:cytochrome c oxidase subunit IV